MTLFKDFMRKVFRPRRIPHVYIAIAAALTIAAIESVIAAWKEAGGIYFVWALLPPLTFLLTIVLLSNTGETLEKLDEIYKRTPITVNYHPIDKVGSRQSLFNECQVIISKAQKSIFALNSFAEEKSAGQDVEARKAYFRALMDASKRLDYKRVIQMEKGEALDSSFDELYLDHFTEMITERDKRAATPGGHVIELTIAEPRFPSTFLIIDDEYLIWELMEVEMNSEKKENPKKSKKDRFRMRAILVIQDQKKEFIRHFYETIALAKVIHRTADFVDLARTVAATPSTTNTSVGTES